MGGDVCGDCRIDFFYSMSCYALTMNNCGKVGELSNEGADWIFPQFQEIKETSVVLTINKILRVYVGNVGGFKSSDAVGTSIRSGSAYNMVLNPTLDVFPAITHGSWNFRRENHILIYLDFSSIVCMH